MDALKSLGKTLGQMTLYKIGHPAVAETLKIAETHLLEALSQTQGELASTSCSAATAARASASSFQAMERVRAV